MVLQHFFDEPDVLRKPFQAPSGPVLSPVWLALPYSITFVALVFPPGRWRPSMAPVVTAIALYGLNGTSRTAAEHLVRSIMLSSSVLQAWALLFSLDVERDLRPLDQPTVPPPLTWAKVRWVAKLMSAVRGVGWTHQSRAVPPAPTDTKFVFCLRQLAVIIACVLSMDLVVGVATFSPFYLADVPLSKLPWRSLLTTNLPTWGIWMLIQLSPAMAALVTVALGVFEPRDWPPPLGAFSAQTTVAGFWGSYWHSYYRHYFLANAKQLARLGPSSRSDLVILFSVFLQSGLLHAPLGFTWRTRLSITLFFLLQPIAIVFERSVAKYWGPPAQLGFLFTITWLFVTAALIWMPLAEQGLFREEAFPVTLFGRSNVFQADDEAKIWHHYLP